MLTRSLLFKLKSPFLSKKKAQLFSWRWIESRTLLYCIALYCRAGHCCPMQPNALRTFQIYCAPPNLGIRTWICRLNFAQRLIFSGLRFFNEPEISDSRTPARSCSRRTCTQDFNVLKKIPRPQSGLNPRTLDLEASTLPRDHRGRQCTTYHVETCPSWMCWVYSLCLSVSKGAIHLLCKGPEGGGGKITTYSYIGVGGVKTIFT